MKANVQRVKIAMARACLNVDDLCSKADVPRPTVTKVINGRSVRPVTFGRVAKALGVDVTEILED